MDRTIFKSYGAMNLDEMNLTEKDAKELLQENGIEEPSESEIMDEVYANEEFWYDAEQCNLNKALNGNIVAIASVGTWRGRFSGYKLLGNNLNEVLNFNNCDYINVYCDQYNVKADMYHHDGTNHVEYRELREDTNYEVLLDALYNQEPVSREMIRRYTKSLRPYIKEVYGI